VDTIRIRCLCVETRVYPPAGAGYHHLDSCVFSLEPTHPTGPMYFVFCRLQPFYPSHHGSVWVNKHCIANAGLLMNCMMGKFSWESKRRRLWAT
jgi:hypothetical protein